VKKVQGESRCPQVQGLLCLANVIARVTQALIMANDNIVFRNVAYSTRGIVQHMDHCSRYAEVWAG
jgi:hypothetical protein